MRFFGSPGFTPAQFSPQRQARWRPRRARSSPARMLPARSKPLRTRTLALPASKRSSRRGGRRGRRSADGCEARRDALRRHRAALEALDAEARQFRPLAFAARLDGLPVEALRVLRVLEHLVASSDVPVRLDGFLRRARRPPAPCTARSPSPRRRSARARPPSRAAPASSSLPARRTSPPGARSTRPPSPAARWRSAAPPPGAAPAAPRPSRDTP